MRSTSTRARRSAPRSRSRPEIVAGRFDSAMRRWLLRCDMRLNLRQLHGLVKHFLHDDFSDVWPTMDTFAYGRLAVHTGISNKASSFRRKPAAGRYGCVPGSIFVAHPVRECSMAMAGFREKLPRTGCATCSRSGLASSLWNAIGHVGRRPPLQAVHGFPVRSPADESVCCPGPRRSRFGLVTARWPPWCPTCRCCAAVSERGLGEIFPHAPCRASRLRGSGCLLDIFLQRSAGVSGDCFTRLDENVYVLLARRR